MSDFGDIFSSRPMPQRPKAATGARRPGPLALTGLVLGLAVILGSVFTTIWTDKLWFDSVDFSRVFTTLLGTRVLLFVIFGQQISILRTFRPCTISSYSDIPPDCLKHCLDTGKDTDLKMDIAQEKGHFMICTP